MGFAVLLTACTGQAPQRPSQRKGAAPQADSALIALMELNRRMTEAADEQLLQIVNSLPEHYALYERGTWVHMIDPGEAAQPIAEGEECTVYMQVYALDGTLLYDAQETGPAGKYTFIPAIDENIAEWHRGALLRLYAPWYAAYGITGKGRISPYENIRIELEIR